MEAHAVMSPWQQVVVGSTMRVSVCPGLRVFALVAHVFAKARLRYSQFDFDQWINLSEV